MDLYAIIIDTYEELQTFNFGKGDIELKDDGDGIVYIAKWDYSKPIPAGLTLGKPGGN